MPDTPTPPLNEGDRLDDLLARGAPRGKWNVDAMWSRLRAESVLGEREGQSSERPTPVRHSPRSRPLRRLGRGSSFGRSIGIAAAGATLAASVLLGISHSSHVSRASAPSESVREYVTGRGELANIQLSDGTHVTLAAESRLRIPATFGTGERQVTLVGEAIFDVKHDRLVPFRVHVGGAELTDIGTRFDVRGYDSTGTAAVAVAQGALSVATGAAGGPAALVRAGSVAFQQAGRVSVAPLPRSESYFSWAEGTLSFDDRPLSEVLVAIGRWYDLDIVADQLLQGKRLTTQLTTKDPATMLDALAAALDAHVARDGRRVTLTANER